MTEPERPAIKPGKRKKECTCCGEKVDVAVDCFGPIGYYGDDALLCVPCIRKALAVGEAAESRLQVAG